jgi:hypothetical protein
MPGECIFALAFFVGKQSAASSLIYPYSVVGKYEHCVIPLVIHDVPCRVGFAILGSNAWGSCHRVFLPFPFCGAPPNTFSFPIGVEKFSHRDETHEKGKDIPGGRKNALVGVETFSVDLTNEIVEQSSAKRKAEAKLAAVDQAQKPKSGSPAAKILVESYWDSPEAKKSFLGDSNDERDVVKVLELRIERLQQANQTSGGWRDNIDKLWH